MIGKLRRCAEAIGWIEFNRFGIVTLSLIFLIVPHTNAGAADVAPPALRINSPFAAPLWRIGVDASETYVVAASPYKAVSVWPLPDLASQSTLRLPIRDEQRKRAHGVAISPNGDLVATSVPPLAEGNGLPRLGTAKIYVLERASGKQVALLDNIPTRPQALRFSADGTYLAAVLSDGCGLRLWRSEDWKMIGADDEGYAGKAGIADHCSGGGKVLDVDAEPDTTGIEFAKGNEGRLFVTSGDSGVRSYSIGEGGALQRLLTRIPADIGLERPGDIAFSPDGKRLAVGERRDLQSDGPVKLQVAVLSVDELKPVRAPLAISANALMHPAMLDRKQNSDANQTGLEQVAWTANENGEEWIFAGGVFWCAYARNDLLLTDAESVADNCVARFSPEGESEPNFIPVGSDRVMDLIEMPQRGGLLYATQRQIGLTDFDGNLLTLDDGNVFFDENRSADFREGNMTFNISQDGKTVVFDDYRGRYGNRIRLQFDLAKTRLTPVDDMESAPRAPDRDANLIEGWRNSRTAPLVLGEKLVDPQPIIDDVYRSAALLKDRNLVLFGSSDFLRLVDIAGDEAKIVCRQRIEYEAYRVNLTQDGNTAVVGHSDGTLRWYRIRRNGSDCRFDPLLSVHIARDDLGGWTWTAWLPSGEFANDPRARQQIGWQLERKPGEVKFLPYRKLLRLYDDKAVAAALDKPVDVAAVRGFAPILEKAEQQASASASLKVAMPRELAGVNQERVRFTIDPGSSGRWPKKLQVRTGAGVPMPKIFDGKTFAADEPLVVESPKFFDFDIVLPESARMRNGAEHVCFYLDEVRGPCHPIIWQGPLAPAKKRRLWALIIGMSKHKYGDFDLQFTQNDALDMAQLFVDDYEHRAVEHKGGVAPDYEQIHIDLIVSPSTDTAKMQIDRLAQLPFITTHAPTRAGIMEALNQMVARAKTEDIGNDLFLFHFSGHGFIHPYHKDKGRSAFVTYATDPALPAGSLDDMVFTSADLIKALRQIGAQKLVIFDACRVPTAKSDAEPFDPGLVQAEFEDQVLSTHYFFSGLTGQYSLDQQEYAFNQSRPPAERGNGLFSYSLLRAVTDPAADLPGRIDGRNKIEIIEVKRYLDRLFDLGDQKSLASRFRALFKMPDIQQPIYVPARRMSLKGEPPESVVIRSLDQP